MWEEKMIIEDSGIKKNCLSGKTVLLTGSGGGIGYEAARAFVWLGANVIIAEIDEDKGNDAQRKINKEFKTDKAVFYKIDISDDKQIDELYYFISERYGFLDILFNNATITPLGAIDNVSVEQWDKSYAVNLKAPIMLVQKFLPDMKLKDQGTIVFVPSSGAAPFMGAYEIFKTAQVELSNTLEGELEGSNISVYCIGPGLVKTLTAQRGIEKVAQLMGISTEEFYTMNEAHMLSVEEAGVGFAVSVLYAKQYNGKEIGAIQVLNDAGILKYAKEAVKISNNSLYENKDEINKHFSHVVRVYQEQYKGWLERNVFERQWVLRDLKKTVKKSAEQAKIVLDSCYEGFLREDFEAIEENKYILIALKDYYKHQYKLLQGYEKDPRKLKENSQKIMEWIDDIEFVISVLQ